MYLPINNKKVYLLIQKERDGISETYHLYLSILANTVELDLLIGQRVVQGLLGGSLNMGCLFCYASIWLG